MPELNKILFFDIETAPQTATLAEMDPTLAHLWNDKVEQMKQRVPERYGDDCTGESKFQEAGIFAEFGRVVCISVGFIYEVDGVRHFKEKSFFGEDEHRILLDFASLLDKAYSSPCHYLCGHNSKEFDLPFVARRMLIHDIKLPDILNVAGKKPWEVRSLDTMEMWKFGDYKHFTSLKLLCAVFGIPTPKDDIDGSQVASVFYDDKDAQRIAVYCEKDVLATAQVYLRMVGEPTISSLYVEKSLELVNV